MPSPPQLSDGPAFKNGPSSSDASIDNELNDAEEFGFVLIETGFIPEPQRSADRNPCEPPAVAHGPSQCWSAGMLYWALVLFIIAIIAGFLDFGGIAGAAAGIAKILFFIFIVLLVMSLLFGFARRGGPPPV
jgi:uncharacterized membrane protein YtjA (UPF0391 family)